jgi:hypothetical protein
MGELFGGNCGGVRMCQIGFVQRWISCGDWQVHKHKRNGGKEGRMNMNMKGEMNVDGWILALGHLPPPPGSPFLAKWHPFFLPSFLRGIDLFDIQN